MTNELMKVLHIIPSAFEYFDDIRVEAFKILDEENNLGVEADAITLEYGAVTKKEQFEVKTIAPTKKYLGQEPISKNIEKWEHYDIINLHCPFLGEAGKILDWARSTPHKFLVITYHHDFQTPDFFGFLIKLYNYYYLPKLFKAANAVAFFADRYDQSKTGVKMLKNEQKAIVFGMPQDSQDIHSVGIAQDLVMVYNNIMLK